MLTGKQMTLPDELKKKIMASKKKDKPGMKIQIGKKCGRSGSKDKNRPYPACRPKKIAKRITKKEAAKKTGPKRVNWSVTASGKRRKKSNG